MLLSIITINLNNTEGLKRTIESVIDQSSTSFEYIVIDGNSTDGSVNLLSKYSKKIDKIVVEKDFGIYHAMNKGIDLAEGDYILFLNSGDFLFNKNSISNVEELFDGEYEILYGNLIIESSSGKYLHKPPGKLDFNFFLSHSLPHPSSFIKRELFQKFGRYLENLKIVSDWAFFLRVICKENCKYFKIEQTISVFNTEGISYNKKSLMLIETERDFIIYTYYSSFLGSFNSYKLERSNFPFNLFNYLIKKLYKFVNF